MEESDLLKNDVENKKNKNNTKFSSLNSDLKILGQQTTNKNTEKNIKKTKYVSIMDKPLQENLGPIDECPDSLRHS